MIRHFAAFLELECVEMRRKELIDTEGPYVLVVNHQSSLDVFGEYSFRDVMLVMVEYPYHPLCANVAETQVFKTHDNFYSQGRVEFMVFQRFDTCSQDCN